MDTLPNTLTQEFIDFYNMGFNKTKEIEGNLSLDVLEEMRSGIYKKITKFGANIDKINKYLSKCSEIEAQCFIYSLLLFTTFDHSSIPSGKDIKSVLLKYEPFLRDLKEFNRPSK